MNYSVLPDYIVVMTTMFGKKLGCKRCGECAEIADEDFMKAKRIEFNHECKPKLGFSGQNK